MRADVSYQLSVFGNFKTISPDQKTINAMMTSLKEYDMVPSVYQEGEVSFSPANPDKLHSTTVDRLSMISANNDVKISFGVERIDVTHEAKSLDDPLLQIELPRLLDILKKSIKNLSFYRIAINTNTFFDKPDSDTIIQHSKSKIKYYDNFDEFFLRVNKRDKFNINNVEEETNLILTSQKAPEVIALNSKQFTLDNGWLIHFDINTVPENMTDRFGIEEVSTFISQASDMKEEIISNLIG
ncbi:hypothetical protein [Lactococcus lactis]|uniref:hypothetical protein n=1 Tax=Lactococcus lactis TaxID=1358 RepID=UPI002FE4386A